MHEQRRPADGPQRGETGSDAGRRYALLSIAGALLTIGLKFGAYLLTGSVGLFSDATEGIVNLLAALAALWALTIASRPPDREHAYGHSKAEYLSSALEGVLILIAAIGIALAAWQRLLRPQPLAQIGAGVAIAVTAAAVNAGVALVLLRAGKRLGSIALRADAHHLLTDVWSSVGVVAGVLLVSWTGWLALDPIIALLFSINIVWTGLHILRDTANGLLDGALPAAEQAMLEEILARYRRAGIAFHALRTRVAGRRRFISLHVLVPGSWSVQRGHSLCDQLEREIIGRLRGATVFTHLEPSDDPRSWADQQLDRLDAEQPTPDQGLSVLAPEESHADARLLTALRDQFLPDDAGDAPHATSAGHLQL